MPAAGAPPVHVMLIRHFELQVCQTPTSFGRLERACVQFPQTCAQRRVVAAKNGTPWVSPERAAREAAQPAVYGTLPEPHPPTEELALAVKEQIQRQMEDLDLRARKRDNMPTRTRSPASSPVRTKQRMHSFCEQVHPSAGAALPRRSRSRRDGTLRAISFAEDVKTTRKSLGAAIDTDVVCYALFQMHSLLASANERKIAIRNIYIRLQAWTRTYTFASLDASVYMQAHLDDPESEQDQNADDNAFVTQSSTLRTSLHSFFDRARVTVTQMEQPQRTSLAHGPLSDTSSGDLAIESALGELGGPPDQLQEQSEEPRAASPETPLELAHPDTYDETAGKALAAAALPPLQRLTEAVRVPPGQESNPVFGWHNDFLEIRQRGRAAMQELLWARLQGRSEARTHAGRAAGMYHAVTAELTRNPAGLPTRARCGAPPPNIYERAKLFEDDATNSMPLRKAAAALQLEDVQLLERFYSQLVLLVEAQKASDPLSLVVVHTVRHRTLRLSHNCCCAVVLSSTPRMLGRRQQSAVLVHDLRKWRRWTCTRLSAGSNTCGLRTCTFPLCR